MPSCQKGKTAIALNSHQKILTSYKATEAQSGSTVQEQPLLTLSLESGLHLAHSPKSFRFHSSAAMYFSMGGDRRKALRNPCNSQSDRITMKKAMTHLHDHQPAHFSIRQSLMEALSLFHRQKITDGYYRVSLRPIRNGPHAGQLNALLQR